MKRAKEKRPWKGAELMLLVAPLLVLVLWLGGKGASKYLAKPPVFGHASYTQAVAFSPDGKYLLSCGSSNNRIGVDEVALWDLRSRSLVRMLKRDDLIEEVAFARGAKQIAFSTSTGIEVWDGGLKRQLFVLPLAPAKAVSLAFSPDGSVLAAGLAFYKSGRSDEIRLWDARSGTFMQHISGFDGAPEVCFATARRIIALGTRQGSTQRHIEDIQEFDVLSGRRLRLWPRLLGESWWSLSTSPDGTSLATTFRTSDYSYGLALLDLRSGSVRWSSMASRSSHEDERPIYASTDPGTAVFAPDGKTLATGGGAIELRDASTGKVVGRSNSGQFVNNFSFSPDGRTLATAGKRIELLDVSSLAQP